MLNHSTNVLKVISMLAIYLNILAMSYNVIDFE